MSFNVPAEWLNAYLYSMKHNHLENKAGIDTDI